MFNDTGHDRIKDEFDRVKDINNVPQIYQLKKVKHDWYETVSISGVSVCYY